MKHKNTLKAAKQFIQAQGGTITKDLPRCQELSSNGEQCNRVAIVATSITAGEETFYIYKCDLHRKKEE